MKVGDRVEMTEEAIRMRLDGRKQRRTGAVTKIKSAHFIEVLRDGNKKAEDWNVSFWKIID